MKARYWFIAAAVAFVIAAVQIVGHQRHVNDLINTAVLKDQSGQDVSGETKVISTYVKSHMGTSATLYRQASYERAAADAQAAASGSSNGKVYTDAQAACASKADSITQAKCVQSYISSHSQPASNPQPVVMPSQADYTVSVSAPSWTPDSTGFAVAVALIAAVGGVFVLLRPSRRHY